MANSDKNFMIPVHCFLFPAQTIPKIAVTRQIICVMTANNILIKEFSKLNIRFPQSPQKHYFSAPGIIFIQTLTFKKNKPVQKRNKAQHQAAMAEVASGQRQLSFLRLNANAVRQKAGTSSSSKEGRNMCSKKSPKYRSTQSQERIKIPRHSLAFESIKDSSYSKQYVCKKTVYCKI